MSIKIINIMKKLDLYIPADELKTIYGEIENGGFLMLFATSSIFTDPDGISFIRDRFNEIEEKNDIYSREEGTEELFPQEEQDTKGEGRNIEGESREVEEKPN